MFEQEHRVLRINDTFWRIQKARLRDSRGGIISRSEGRVVHETCVRYSVWLMGYPKQKYIKLLMEMLSVVI